MKTSLIALALLIVAICSPAFAAPIDFDDHGDYTTDTISGLSWLDVDLTSNLSYNDVTGFIAASSTVGGVDYSGLRYATEAEFITMADNFFGTSFATPGLFPLDPTNTAHWLQLFGATSSQPTVTSSAGLLSTSGASAPVAALSFDFSAIPVAIGGLNSAGINLNVNDPTIGSFLVRNNLIATPLPAAVLMFAPALLGFLGFRRKAKATA